MDIDTALAFLGLLLVGVLIGAPILAVIAFTKSNANERRLADARRALAAMSREIAELRSRFDGEGIGPAPQETVDMAARLEDAAPAPAPLEPEVHATETIETAPPAAAAPTPAKPEIKSLETALTSRWFVWLGALAIALSGVFLVKYAIDRQLLTPATRVTLGLLLGLSLAVAGEVLRRRPLQRAIAAVRPNHVPPALTASGLFVAFASIYSAYGLYGLVGPLAAFAGLSLVALLAVGLSLLQGRFVALMGLLGAFLAPALVATPHPSVWALFGYLAVVEAACLAVSRYRGWWWFALATLAGTAFWPLAWIADSYWTASDALPVGLFLLLSAGAYFLLRAGLASAEPRESWLEDIRHLDMPARTVAIAAGAIALLLLVVADAAGYNIASLVVFGLAAALYLFVGRREGILDILSVVSAVAALAVLAAMPVPHAIAPAPFPAHPPLIPPELSYFSITAVAFGALFGIGGFVALWGARRPSVWAGVSAAMPVAALAIAYWRIVDFGVDLKWAAIAVALAAVALVAAERIERYREARGLDAALGVYAAAVVAFVSLAAAMSLRQAWLTVALSLQLPALGWISRRVSARAIRLIAAAVVGIVIVRLVLNYNVLTYPVTGATFNWIVYGYGIPAAASFAAAHLFGRSGRDNLVTALEAAGLAFSVLLVSLEIRLFVTGALDAARYTLLEQSLQSIAWLAIGTGLAIRDAQTRNVVSRYGARILLGAAAAQILLLQLLASNPLATGEAVGRYPLVNILSLAYLVPAAFAVHLAMRGARGQGVAPWQGPVAAVAGFGLVFADISFEIRRAFHGAVLTTASHGDAELYTYSAAWLVYAAALLGLGIALRQSLMRYAGLAVLMIVALKVFLIDMSGLTGLYRVASFLGLGLSLVGIGYLYQRFVNTRA
jgi:uncharacterized membrane protein